MLRFRQRQRHAAAPEEASDEALVARALHDRQAFGLLYDRYAVPVYRYCYGRLGGREEAEDATSLVFSRALAALPTHRGDSFRSWLFAIAHNVVINARRDASHHLDARLCRRGAPGGAGHQWGHAAIGRV